MIIVMDGVGGRIWEAFGCWSTMDHDKWTAMCVYVIRNNFKLILMPIVLSKNKLYVL